MRGMLIILSVAICQSCISTVILNPHEEETESVVKEIQPRAKPVIDTARVAIDFDVSVNDWDRSEINFNCPRAQKQ